MSKKMATAYHEMGTMMDAGMPIVRALDVACGAMKGRQLEAFSNIREHVSKGGTAAESMDEQRRVFSNMDVMILRAAETSGDLGESFKMLSQWHEFVSRMKRRLLTGLLYPFFIVHAAAFILPAPGFILDLLYGEASVWGYLMDVASILAILYVPTLTIWAIVEFTPDTGRMRRIVDTIAMRIPGLAGAMLRLSLARYAKTFHMLYKGGVPIIQTAEQATEVCGNAVVRDLVEGGVEKVRAGEDLSKGFKEGGLPAEFVQLWKIGEESGELEKVTRKLGDTFAESGEFRMQLFCAGLTKAIYFLIVAIMAFMVVYMAISIYGQALSDAGI